MHMIDIDEQKKIAVLIDADNTPGKKLKPILQEIAVHGHIITKRAYGDFTIQTLKNWKDDLNNNAVIHSGKKFQRLGDDNRCDGFALYR